MAGFPTPANAEIVVECYAGVDGIRSEKPFGEWLGTAKKDSREESHFRVGTQWQQPSDTR